MDDATRTAVLQLLGGAMSAISEECWSAGWISGTEDAIPGLCHRALESGRTQHWGRWSVTLEQARGLTFVAEQLGCWADLDDGGVRFVAHHPFPLTAEVLAAFGHHAV
ncbi:hypothetical protein [Gemmata sp.]|uniref:hypothetical protein n=1 Tax=Gemmata sp. TaxID=1914242 RepID=UPI003F6E55C4